MLTTTAIDAALRIPFVITSDAIAPRPRRFDDGLRLPFAIAGEVDEVDAMDEEPCCFAGGLY